MGKKMVQARIVKNTKRRLDRKRNINLAQTSDRVDLPTLYCGLEVIRILSISLTNSTICHHPRYLVSRGDLNLGL